MAQRAEGTTVGIRLHPGEWGLSASDFLMASNHMMVMLGELDIAISDVARRSMDWRIAHISYNSPAELLYEPVLRDDAPMDYRNELIRASINGLAILSDRPERPRHFSDKALRSARSLVNLLGDFTPKLQVFGNGTIIECSEIVSANVREILRAGRDIIGSIEGRLDRLDSSDRFRFRIHEPVLNYGIEGEIAPDADDALHDQIVSLYEQTVVIDGTLRTNPHGEVRRIMAQAIRVRPRRSAFQKVGDIAGIYDITGGVEVAEYVRSMRDAE